MTDVSPPGPAPSRGRLVVGVDGSTSSVAALRWALEQARLTGGEVHAVGCWHWPPMTGAAAGSGLPALDLGAVTQEAVEGAVQKACADAGVDPAEVRTRVVEGYPARVLLEQSRDAALLVVGSRGHSELSGLLLGSVGLHCVSSAPCPVVVVRGTEG